MAIIKVGRIYYDLDQIIPAELKAELDQIKADIIAGKLVTWLNPPPK